jgi:hypothetical protein
MLHNPEEKRGIQKLIIMNPGNNINIYSLFSKGLVFVKETHQYFFNSIEVCSVTNLVRRYANLFPMHSIAERVAAKRGVTREVVEKEWVKNGQDAARRGELAHGAIEQFVTQGFINPEYRELIMSVTDEVLAPADSCGFKDVLSECRFINREYEYAGTFDLAMFKGREVMLFDFKTSKFDERSNGWMKPPISELPCSKDVIYSLQLHLYKAALESYGFEVVNMEVVYINETGVRQKKKPLDLEDACKRMLINFLENKNEEMEPFDELYGFSYEKRFGFNK